LHTVEPGRELVGRLTTAFALLNKTFYFLGEEIQRLSLNESAERGVQKLSRDIAKYLDETAPFLTAPTASAPAKEAKIHAIIKAIAPEIAAMKDNPDWHPNMYQSRFDSVSEILGATPVPASVPPATADRKGGGK